MRWAIGVIVAPRPVPTVQVTIDSITASWDDDDIVVFAEPWALKEAEKTNCALVVRPDSFRKTDLTPSPDGVFGNFQNWIQSARDLLHGSPTADAIMLCEDDAEIKYGIGTYVESHLWPSRDCGVVSLCCLNYPQNRTRHLGLAQPRVAGALFGAQCLVFPRHVLEVLVQHASIPGWGNSIVEPWERKAVDTWIGRTLSEMGRTCWIFRPSLVNHYAPNPQVSNSSLDNGFNRGPRSIVGWTGVAFNQAGWPKPKEVFQKVE